MEFYHLRAALADMSDESYSQLIRRYNWSKIASSFKYTMNVFGLECEGYAGMRKEIQQHLLILNSIDQNPSIE
ncbi:hypothetical protein RRG08_039767 [Elysia crispata]|uniref:Uncharacterized protein n=1 Tax=Elysia crispata TaxID=231223 RepID=A0AAE1DLY9_9GAST|nr:hypothetical protein RRG08_039767 [Elysia crispata]